METSPDTEITLGTAKLLGLFFGLVVICAVFFALGYALGRKSDGGVVASSTSPPPATTSSSAKPATSNEAAPAMSFYKAVEQNDANPQLTPAAENAGTTPTGETTAAPSASASSTPSSATAAASTPSAPGSASTNLPGAISVPTSAYFVQVAAVSKEDDAQALVDALKKKNYPAFVAASSSGDKLFHVQVGPFSDIRDAESMRSRLVSDGYTPILKK
jgi:cell division septation protein DedD